VVCSEYCCLASNMAGTGSRFTSAGSPFSFSSAAAAAWLFCPGAGPLGLESGLVWQGWLVCWLEGFSESVVWLGLKVLGLVFSSGR
jgi:hypothetical protein